MKGLKINVWRVKNVISCQVIELNNFDKYRDKGLLFTSSDGYKIISERSNCKYHGDISSEAIWIPTSTDDPRMHKVNSRIFFKSDGGEKKAEEVLEKVRRALSEWQKHI